MTELRNRVLARVQRCIDEGIFPATVQAVVALRLLWAPVIGITRFPAVAPAPGRRRRGRARPRRHRHHDRRPARRGSDSLSRACAGPTSESQGIMSPIIHQVALKRALTTTGPPSWCSSLPWPRLAARRVKPRTLPRGLQPGRLCVSRPAGPSSNKSPASSGRAALKAQDDAEVAAEIAGRVIATPVERGMPIRSGADLVRIAATEVEAQAQEADANVAQIEARLGEPTGASLDVDRVPEVASARATHDLAKADFARTGHSSNASSYRRRSSSFGKRRSRRPGNVRDRAQRRASTATGARGGKSAPRWHGRRSPIPSFARHSTVSSPSGWSRSAITSPAARRSRR